MKLIIENIDLSLLEIQRKTLNKALVGINLSNGTLELSVCEVDALQGITNMLDEWSDERYFKKNKEENRK